MSFAYFHRIEQISLQRIRFATGSAARRSIANAHRLKFLNEDLAIGPVPIADQDSEEPIPNRTRA